MLFKVLQYEESVKWVPYLLLVITEKFETHIFNMCHSCGLWAGNTWLYLCAGQSCVWPVYTSGCYVWWGYPTCYCIWLWLVPWNAIVNAKYNKYLLCSFRGMSFVEFLSSLLGVYWSWYWFRLLFVCLFQFFYPLFQLRFNSVTGFCWSLLFWNDTRYMWVNFVPSWVLCGNAVQWCYHLCTGISFTPPFQGESSPRKLYAGKEKKCVKEMTVEVRFFSGCPGSYLWNSRDFPYNRNDCNVDSIPLE